MDPAQHTASADPATGAYDSLGEPAHLSDRIRIAGWVVACTVRSATDLLDSRHTSRA